MSGSLAAPTSFSAAKEATKIILTTPGGRDRS